MAARTKRGARPACKQTARHAQTGIVSLTPGAKDCIFAAVMVVLCLGIVWGIAAMYQKGYVQGYEDAKEAQHG